MATTYDVPINDLISTVAETLKNVPEIKAPEWAPFVKTGHNKERPPALDDWWHTRTAAILVTVQKKGPIGVSKLRTKYGGRKNRGHKPDKFYRASGNILRKVLQQLEAAKLVEQKVVSNHKGRVITPKGVSLLNKGAASIYKKYSPKAAPVAAKPAPPTQKAPTPVKKPEVAPVAKTPETSKK